MRKHPLLSLHIPASTFLLWILPLRIFPLNPLLNRTVLDSQNENVVFVSEEIVQRAKDLVRGAEVDEVVSCVEGGEWEVVGER